MRSTRLLETEWHSGVQNCRKHQIRSTCKHLRKKKVMLLQYSIQLNIATNKRTPGKTRYVDGTPMSEVTPVTIRYVHHPCHGHGHELSTPSLSFHVNQPSHSSNKAISNFDLETTRSRSWLWSKGKTIQSAQYLINLLSFCLTSIR